MNVKYERSKEKNKSHALLPLARGAKLRRKEFEEKKGDNLKRPKRTLSRIAMRNSKSP